MTSLLTLSGALMRGYLRDRAALFFTIVFPLIFLFLLGGLLGGAKNPRSNVVLVGPVAVYDGLPAHGKAKVDQVLAITRSHDLHAALADVRNGNEAAAVVQRGTGVVIYDSGASPSSAGAVSSVFQYLVDASNLAAAGGSGGSSPRVSTAGQAPRVALSTSQVDDKSLKEIQYLTPGILGWAIATGATFAAASTLIVWRQRKLMRRLTLSPVSVRSVIGARILVSLGIALAQTVLFVVVAVLAFHLKLSGAWWMAIPLVLAGTLAFLSIGLLAGALTKSVEAASALANLIVIPMAFLSGAFIPINDVPSWVQSISQVLPLRHLNDAVLDVLARGDGPVTVLPQLGVLLGFALVIALIAIRLFRWDDA
ncbi:MAG TPA: ABC transporter permease [Streptosporangiaceae bacterium]|nr:ABC transporter permease [Streptosporangiaceae bacterium]